MTTPPMAKAARPALERLLNGRVHGHVVLLREVQANVLPEHAVDPDGDNVDLRRVEAVVGRHAFEELCDDHIGVLQRVVGRANRGDPEAAARRGAGSRCCGGGAAAALELWSWCCAALAQLLAEPEEAVVGHVEES